MEDATWMDVGAADELSRGPVQQPGEGALERGGCKGHRPDTRPRQSDATAQENGGEEGQGNPVLPPAT